MNATPLPPKKEVAHALLERGSVHVHMDPRATGVVVPAWFKRQPQLVLQVGLNMPVPIPDLRIDEEGMSCTLSFNRSPFFCVVPWSSVYAMVGDDGRGMVWPEDVPPEVALQARGGDAEPTAKKPPPKRALAAVASPKPTAKPRVVRGEAATKAKKPRAKRPRGGSPEGDARATEGASRGVVVAIPSKTARRPVPTAGHAEGGHPTTLPGARPSTPLEPSPAARSPAARSPHAGGAGHFDPAAAGSERVPGSPPARKPTGGKTKREIPPYLRVVK